METCLDVSGVGLDSGELSLLGSLLLAQFIALAFIQAQSFENFAALAAALIVVAAGFDCLLCVTSCVEFAQPILQTLLRSFIGLLTTLPAALLLSYFILPFSRPLSPFPRL